jgi:hypothetical protein
MRRLRLGWMLAVAGSSLATDARAFERQWHLGGGLGAASFVGSDEPIAPAASLYAAYGLSDMFDARLEFTGSRHPLDDGSHVVLYSGAAGIAYKIDVIEWVPYVGLLAGYYSYDFATAGIGFSTALGLDYAVSRNLGLGAQLRYHWTSSDVPTSLTEGEYFTAFLRAEYRWGW